MGQNQQQYSLYLCLYHHVSLFLNHILQRMLLYFPQKHPSPQIDRVGFGMLPICTAIRVLWIKGIFHEGFMVFYGIFDKGTTLIIWHYMAICIGYTTHLPLFYFYCCCVVNSSLFCCQLVRRPLLESVKGHLLYFPSLNQMPNYHSSVTLIELATR